MFVSYTPAGAAAPSQAAGVQFALEMNADALAYHLTGDETDPACCPDLDAPCQIRIWLEAQREGLREQAGSASRTPILGTDETPQIRQDNAGSAVATSSRKVADLASEAQIRFVQTLISERDTSKIGTFPGRTLAEIQAGSEVSKSRASGLISALKAAKIRTDAPAPTATPAQIRFIQTMAEEQGRTLHTDPATLTKDAASDLITDLVAAREIRTSPEAARTPAGPQDGGSAGSAPGSAVTEDGMYRTPDGEIYKVQVAVHGSGRLYAKKLVEREEPRVYKNGKISTHEFVMESGAIRKLTADMKMTLEQAKEWGALYGTCCQCGAQLTDEKSIADGIGPICGNKF